MSIIYRIKRILQTKYYRSKYNQFEYVRTNNTTCRLELLNIWHKYLSFKFFCMHCCENYLLCLIVVLQYHCNFLIIFTISSFFLINVAFKLNSCKLNSHLNGIYCFILRSSSAKCFLNENFFIKIFLFVLFYYLFYYILNSLW